MINKKDWCTWFPEYWLAWRLPSKWWKFWEWWKVVYIGDICKKHDENCGSHGFYKNLWNARIVGAVSIATVASLACWAKYTSKMFKRV